MDEIHAVMPLIERFVVVLYERCSEDEEVNVARKNLFSKGRDVENIPPTEDALQLHTLHAVYQAGYIWRQSLQKDPQLPSPNAYGWNKDEVTGAWEVQTYKLKNTLAQYQIIPLIFGFFR